MKANYGKPKKDQGFPVIGPSRHAKKNSTKAIAKEVKPKKAERNVAKKGRT